MLLCLKNLKRDFWKLMAFLLLVITTYFCYETIYSTLLFNRMYSLSKFWKILSIFVILTTSLFYIFCATSFFKKQKGNFWNLVGKYWYYLFIILIIFAAERLILEIKSFIAISLLKDISNGTIITLLARLASNFFSSLIFVFPFILLISISYGVNYLRGMQLAFEYFKILFIKVFLLIFSIACSISLITLFTTDPFMREMHNALGQVSIAYIIEFIKTAFLAALPAYYILSIVSEYDKKEML